MHTALRGPYVWQRFLTRTGFYGDVALLFGTVVAALELWF